MAVMNEKKQQNTQAVLYLALKQYSDCWKFANTWGLSYEDLAWKIRFTVASTEDHSWCLKLKLVILEITTQELNLTPKPWSQVKTHMSPLANSSRWHQVFDHVTLTLLFINVAVSIEIVYVSVVAQGEVKWDDEDFEVEQILDMVEEDVSIVTMFSHIC